ncbi:MAG: respiratory nitrate reductase subunit gamma [Nitrospirota bacterium]
MGAFLTFLTYFACVVFLTRFLSHVQSWIKAAKQPAVRAISQRVSPGMAAEMLLDIVLLRRLFRTNKLLWIASLTFHLSLLIVVLRHLRYFLYPVPDFVLSIQNAGVAAGYALPLSLLVILIIRSKSSRDRYLSVYNFFLLAILLLTCMTGILLNLFYRTSLVDIKAFIIGIVTFHPDTLPDSIMFVMHFILIIMLIPSLPFHLIAAPLITVEARKREEELGLVLHEK